MPSWKKIIVEGSAPLVSSSAVVAGETLTDGYVTGITPSTQINDILAELNTALGRLAPSRPAGLTGRGLRVTNTTYQSGIAHSSDWAGGLAGATPTLQVLTGSTVNLTSSQASTAIAGATVQFSASSTLGGAPAGVAVVTFGSGPTGGTSGVLAVGNIIDPYSSTAPGFWYTFSASIASATAPQTVGTFSSASYIVRETGNNTVASQSIYVDSVTTPSLALALNGGNPYTTIPSAYVSGLPTLTTGSTLLQYTASSITNTVGKFYKTSNLLTLSDSNGVFSFTGRAPVSAPASASTLAFSGSGTVLAGKFFDGITAGGGTITATATNIAGGTGTATSPYDNIFVDSVSYEGNRLYSSASTAYPNQSQYLAGTFTSATALTDSKNKYGSNTIVEAQLRNGLYIKPTSNYSALYDGSVSGIDYSAYSSYASASFSQFYDINFVKPSFITMSISGNNFGSTSGATKITSGISIIVKFYNTTETSYTVWGDANAAQVVGGEAADGRGILNQGAATTGNSTSIVRVLNMPSLINTGGTNTFNNATDTLTRAYVRIVVWGSTVPSVNQNITFS